MRIPSSNTNSPLFYSWILLFGFLLGGSGCTSSGSSMEALQGEWQGLGPPGDISISISNDSLNFFVRDDFWYETTFKLEESTDPGQLHATIRKSPNNDSGQVVYALFKIENGELTLAVDDGSDEPPFSFAEATSTYVVSRK